MKRFAGVRFDGVLGASERDAAMRPYVSAGATATSWIATGRRSYLTLHGPEEALASVAPLAVLRVRPAAGHLLATLLEALGGAGAPAGVFGAYRDGPSVVVEFDPKRTPLALVVAAIDSELAAWPGRTIEPLVELADETLVAFARVLLGEPDLDVSRLIETYVEPLLAAGPA